MDIERATRVLSRRSPPSAGLTSNNWEKDDLKNHYLLDHPPPDLMGSTIMRMLPFLASGASGRRHGEIFGEQRFHRVRDNKSRVE